MASPEAGRLEYKTKHICQKQYRIQCNGVRTRIYVYTCVYTYKYVCIYLHMYICIYICVQGIVYNENMLSTVCMLYQIKYGRAARVLLFRGLQR